MQCLCVRLCCWCLLAAADTTVAVAVVFSVVFVSAFPAKKDPIRCITKRPCQFRAPPAKSEHIPRFKVVVFYRKATAPCHVDLSLAQRWYPPKCFVLRALLLGPNAAFSGEEGSVCDRLAAAFRLTSVFPPPCLADLRKKCIFLVFGFARSACVIRGPWLLSAYHQPPTPRSRERADDATPQICMLFVSPPSVP